MKYKVELEFTVDEPCLDELDREMINNGETTIESLANYAINNNLSKYDGIVCGVIGFPGYYSVKKIIEDYE